MERKTFCTFATANREAALLTIGALVQLVRMPACHAGGHESESRTHRLKALEVFSKVFLFSANQYLSLLKGNFPTDLCVISNKNTYICIRITETNENLSIHVNLNNRPAFACYYAR